MSDTVWLTIDWRASDGGLLEAQRERLTQRMFWELRSHPHTNAVTRIPDPAIPSGAMGMQWLWSILTAEISGNGLQQVCEEVFSRLPGQPMELTVEVDEKSQKIDVKNVRPGDYEAVIEKLIEAAQRMKED